MEWANCYLETSFLPGRTFDSPDDFNAQLTVWLAKANQRVHATMRCRPADQLAEDLGAMLPLPPVPPEVALRFSVRLGRDHYVRVGTNDYSVHPAAIGRRVEVRVDLDEILVTCGERRWRGIVARGRPTAPSPRWSTVVPERGCATLPAPRGLSRSTCNSAIWPTTTARWGWRDDPPQARSDVTYLCRALKAPSLLAAVDRLAERARTENWSHEEFLAACLEREVAARQDHGGEARTKAARFPARKMLEDFDFDHQRSLPREVIAHFGTLDFVEARDNVVFLGPPGHRQDPL